MRSSPLYLLAAIALASATQLEAQDAMFVLRRGQDTISLERFNRSPARISSELLVKSAGVRMKFSGDINGDNTISRLKNEFWLGNDSPDGPPRQTALLTLVGDSAIVEVSAGSGPPKTQRLGTKSGALPYLNPSFAMMELVIARARSAGIVEVPTFLISGGQTVDVSVKPVGTDSIVLTMAGGEMRVRVDQQGRIVGGSIPAQGLTIDRTSAGAASLAVAKPDYSAPAGAPYTAEDVMVSTPMGHTLAGTLTLPRGAAKGAPVPAVVTITGSGQEDRDEAIPMFKGYRPFREFADSLGRRGIAVLRMDDRGFGGSGGDATKSTSADFAQDIQAGLAYLRTRSEVDPKRLALMGHSEGGIIAPMVAKDEPTLKAIVLLAGTAYTGKQILTFQLSNNIKHDTSLTASKRDSSLKAVPSQIDSMGAKQPWLKFFNSYDPLETARHVTTPVLILNGANDQQVTPDQAPLLEKAFKVAGNKDVTMKVLPSLNHLFVYDPSGYPGAYTDLKSFAVDRPTIGLVVDWLAKRLLKPTA